MSKEMKTTPSLNLHSSGGNTDPRLGRTKITTILIYRGIKRSFFLRVFLFNLSPIYSAKEFPLKLLDPFVTSRTLIQRTVMLISEPKYIFIRV